MRKLIVILVFITIANSASFAEEKHLDHRAVVFIEKFKIQGSAFLQPETLNSDPKSPWFHYLDEPFDVGLSGKNAEDYLAFQKQGLCLNVIELDLLGFLKQNPHLISVFETNQKIQEQFRMGVAGHYSRGLRRCVARTRLQKYGFFAKQRGEFSAVDVESIQSDQSKVLVTNEEKLYKDALLQSLDVAICRDYTPAQKDMIFWKRQNLPFIISNETYLYLLKRIERKGGMGEPDFLSAEIKRTKKQTPYHSVLLEAAYHGEVKNLEFAMPFWFQNCLKANQKSEFKKN